MSHNILIVDNDPAQCRAIELMIVNNLGHSVVIAESGKKALSVLSSDNGPNIDLMLLDLSMPEMDGREVVKEVRKTNPNLPIIINTAYGDVSNAVDCLKEGADDFVEKQDGPERLSVSINNVLKMHNLKDEVERLKRSNDGEVSFSDIIGESSSIEKAKTVAKRAAQSNISVLIKGESGTGKELFARAIHGSSGRAGKPFVAINCGAIPENLVESVLFGHEKGSFTGASGKSIGKFREAHGGTLFLDEIGELKPDVQVKLLRVLQESEVQSVGGKEPIKIDVRFISATHRNLELEVGKGTFREDLFYRVNVFPVTIPSINRRKVDIPLLVAHFIKKFSAQENKNAPELSESAAKLLENYDWPGNVRQIENSVYRAIVLCDSGKLTVGDFPQVIKPIGRLSNLDSDVMAPSGHSLSLINKAGDFKDLAILEEEVIRSALEFYSWHISKVARKLCIGRSTLYRKMSEYGIDKNSALGRDDAEKEEEVA